MDLMVDISSPHSISSPSLSTPTPTPAIEELVCGDPASQQCIQILEREFQQVQHHIKLLVQKKVRLLHEMHKHRSACGDVDNEADQHTINRWKEISTRYLYAAGGDDGSEKRPTRFPLFNVLPNEVLLHIFSYLGAVNLCENIMRACALFCAIALDESLWRPLYCQNWGNHRVHVVLNSSDGGVTWRSLFSRQFKTESNWWRGCNDVSTFIGHKGAVRCLQFVGDTLVTGSADKTIKVWSLNDGKCMQTLHDTKWVRCLRYDEPSATLVTTSMDSTQAKLWNLTTNTVAHVLDVHRGWITCLQLNMPTLVTGSLDGTIRVWDASTGHNQPTSVLHSGHDSLRSLWLAGDLVMSAGLEHHLQLWDLRTQTTKPSVTIAGALHGNYCVQFDTSTHTAVSGSNTTVALADLRVPSAPPVLLKGHTDVISCLQLAGRKLVTGSMDQTIRVWDVTTHHCANTLHGHESWVWDLQFDPDKIVTASGDKVVKLWAFNHHSTMPAL